MPKATAVWLLDNTALTFDQIAEFCKLHPLEIKAIADGDAAQGIKGLDPIQTGQLTREQITAAEANHEPQADADRAEGRGSVARARRQEGPALYAGVAPAGPAERHSVAGAQSSRAQGRADHAAGRHHQVDHRGDPRPHPLERRGARADGPGDARACHARPISISRSTAPTRKSRRRSIPARRCCRPPKPPRARRPKSPPPPRKPRSKPGGSDLDVSAVFAKLKQLGGKGEKEEGKSNSPCRPREGEDLYAVPFR